MSPPEGCERTCRSWQGCRYVGSALINSSRAIRKRLWQRPGACRAGAEGDEAAGDAMGEAGADRRVRHLRGEGDLRHASLQDFPEEDGANPTKGD
jgi:bifunctional non-homologous end joining protein LigD